MGSFFKNIRQMTFTLRFCIFAIFIILFVTTSFLLIGITYTRFTRAMSTVANTMMQNVTASLLYTLEREIEQAASESRFGAEMVKHNVLDADNFQELTHYTSDVIKNMPIAQAAYWGDEQGNFVLAAKQADNTILSVIADRKKTPATRTLTTLDWDERVINSNQSADVNYDPRQRPWYLEAKAAKKTIWTEIYLFQPSNLQGVTVATPVYRKDGSLRGIFAVDIRLDYLYQFIAQQKIGKKACIYMVTTDGKLILLSTFKQALPVSINFTKLIDIHTVNVPWLAESFDTYKENNKSEFTFKYQDKTFLANVKVVPQIAMNHWLIGLIVPEDDFIGELKKTNIITLILSLLILITGIILISKLLTRVVKPLQAVVRETERIKDFELDDEVEIRSRISEVAALAEAIRAMKRGLRSFEKYVPAALVHQLIAAKEDAGLSGNKKKLVVFFSDIKNFTSMAEHMDPTELMAHMCEYLDEMSLIISEELGTIDKYIGDSIMAFWGAPLPQEKPVMHAARAALRCLLREHELNEKWRAENRPGITTRIGIHLGEAVVGNLGSSKRLSYTAIGDTINIASRLEGINKTYGTRIIVSEIVYKAIKSRFVFRFIDCVALKGKQEQSAIYELLGDDPAQIAFNIESYRLTFERGFAFYQQRHWDEAIDCFNQCLHMYPADSVAPLFITRCRNFKINPPLESWNGVWQMQEK